MRADHLPLWHLFILSFYLPVVLSVISDPTGIPQTFWFDSSCSQEGFDENHIGETINLAGAGAYRLFNDNDPYQAWIFQKLFGRARDTRVFNGESTSETWNVLSILAWIANMKLETTRDNADVRIYCDNDERWTLVPDDAASVIPGLPPNSRRTFGISQEFEDKENYMRRDTSDKGCAESEQLGVTYTTPIPYDPNSRGTRVPQGYHSFRQTITICDLSLLHSEFSRLSELSNEDWDALEIFTLESIPTVVLLYQFLTLNNYRLYRGDGTVNIDQGNFEAAEDSWANVIQNPPSNVGFVHKPGPYLWNAIFALLATGGWALRQGLPQDSYVAGVDLLQYNNALKTIPFRAPPLVPASLNIPAGIFNRPPPSSF